MTTPAPSTPASSTPSSDTASESAAADEMIVPEPSERPSDPETPSDATPPADSSVTSAIIAAATPAALPVRDSVQGWGVQAGAFKTASNASALRDRLLKAGLAARVEIGADGVNRVLVGAYVSAQAAKAASASVAAALK